MSLITWSLSTLRWASPWAKLSSTWVRLIAPLSSICVQAAWPPASASRFRAWRLGHHAIGAAPFVFRPLVGTGEGNAQADGILRRLLVVRGDVGLGGIGNPDQFDTRGRVVGGGEVEALLLDIGGLLPGPGHVKHGPGDHAGVAGRRIGEGRGDDGGRGELAARLPDILADPRAAVTRPERGNS